MRDSNSEQSRREGGPSIWLRDLAGSRAVIGLVRIQTAEVQQGAPTMGYDSLRNGCLNRCPLPDMIGRL
jgi:hypothetical protein